MTQKTGFATLGQQRKITQWETERTCRARSSEKESQKKKLGRRGEREYKNTRTAPGVPGDSSNKKRGRGFRRDQNRGGPNRMEFVAPNKKKGERGMGRKKEAKVEG